MVDFWNFKDVLVVAQANFLWLAMALVLGLIVGWMTCVRSDDTSEGNR